MVNVRSKSPPVPALVLIGLAFAVLTTGFVAASLYGELRARSIDRDAQSIEENGIPSIEHLANAQGALVDLEVAAERQLDAPAGRQGTGAIRVDKERLTSEVEAELANPKYPGEVEADEGVRDAVRALGQLVQRVEEGAGDPSSRQDLRRELRAGIERTDLAVERLLAANAQG